MMKSCRNLWNIPQVRRITGSARLGTVSYTHLLPVMGAALVFHGIGVVYGSRNAVRINQNLLKKGIAVFSILIAIWKLL